MLAPCQLATRQLSPACLIVLAPPPGLRGGPSACMLDRWRGESPCMMGTRAFFVAVDRPIERNQPSERERSSRERFRRNCEVCGVSVAFLAFFRRCFSANRSSSSLHTKTRFTVLKDYTIRRLQTTTNQFSRTSPNDCLLFSS